MEGDSWEWGLDWYSYGDYYDATQSGCSDCANLTVGDSRGMRGGAWNRSGPFLRAAYRLYGYPSGRSDSLGFRCAKAAP